MTQNDTVQISAWFERYAESFYSTDLTTQICLKSRYEHSLRTCQEMAYLTDSLGLCPHQQRTAQTIALLHDIGRFEQFVQYGTFFDHVSTDHGSLGSTILERTGVIDHLPPAEQDAIITAVRHHNKRASPETLSESQRLFLDLIRDADKLDIFENALGYYQRRQSGGQGRDWEIELVDDPVCSPRVLSAVLAGRQIEHCHLLTIHDMQIAQMAWIYDVRFGPAYHRLRERKVLERLICLLPDDAPADEIHKRISLHMDAQIGAAPACKGS